MPKFCPRCGARALPGARFCRSCGARLVSNTSPKQEADQETNEELADSQYEQESSYEDVYAQAAKVELTTEEEESLMILSEILPIQKKISELKKEKDNLEIKFRVEEEISEKEYDSQIKKINKNIEKYEEEIADKRKAMASVSLLNLVQEVIEMRERQDKLEKIYKEGRIQESTYDRLKKEYKDKEKTTQAKVDEEEARLKQYRRNLKDEKEQISSMKEELFARHSVGEFSEEEYREKLKELESRNIDGLIAAVDEVLARMGKV